MSLVTYDDLVKQIINWSHRDDLGTKIDDFILIAENAMYSNDVAPLKVRSMEVVSTAATAGQYLALPDNYESTRSIRLTIDGGEIKFQAPEQIRKLSSTGRPNFFTIVGSEIQFDRTPDSEYTIEMQYFRKADPINVLNQTNEILTEHPSIYLYGALMVVFGYSQDTEQEASYTTKFYNAIRGANKGDKKGRYGPAPSLSIDDGMIV